MKTLYHGAGGSWAPDPVLLDKLISERFTAREAEAHTFAADEDLFAKIKAAHRESPIHTVMCDEAQFLSVDQVWALSDVVDDLGIDVRCYGLVSDFRGDQFDGSRTLISLADSLIENTGICPTGAKATMVLRMGPDGKALVDGPQVLVGGEETYLAVSRKEWKRRVREASVPEAMSA